jgi:hypothetical protein
VGALGVEPRRVPVGVQHGAGRFTSARALLLIVESAEQRTAYGECLVGCGVQVVRIATSLALVERRTAGTVRGPEWELAAAFASNERAEQAAVENFAVSNDRPLAEVAQEIVERAGWVSP